MGALVVRVFPGVFDDPNTNFPLDGYLIGERLNISRAGLLRKAAALIAKATADNLPGYDDAAEIQKAQAALDAYRGSESESDTADSDQVGDTANRDELIKTINTRAPSSTPPTPSGPTPTKRTPANAKPSSCLRIVR